jgi:adenylate cyclase
MPIEIERKFLPANDAWRDAAHAVIPMAQGYINDQAAMDTPPDRRGAQRASVRVRIAGDEAFLNLKSRELGRSRQEFDYPIPVEDARALLALCVGGVIDKRRHLVRHGEHLWEIDEFLGDNAGLVVAEVELDAVDAAFERPAWLGGEVTELPRYYNLALAARPYSRWSEHERRAHDAGQPGTKQLDSKETD